MYVNVLITWTYTYIYFNRLTEIRKQIDFAFDIRYCPLNWLKKFSLAGENSRPLKNQTIVHFSSGGQFFFLLIFFVISKQMSINRICHFCWEWIVGFFYRGSTSISCSLSCICSYRFFNFLNHISLLLPIPRTFDRISLQQLNQSR